MAYKLTVNSNQLGINFNCKYENLSKLKRPPVEAKNNNGDIVRERTIYNGQVLGPGATQRQWVDDNGNTYQKGELSFFYEGEQVEENSQTKILTIEGFQPAKSYTDSYIIDKYYEIYPHTNDMKKDYDKEVARITNLSSMCKLWEYLNQNQAVARGEMIVSSKGFLASDGFLRAISFGNKWALTLGIFKEEMIFQHLNESVPSIPTQATQVGRKKLKMV